MKWGFFTIYHSTLYTAEGIFDGIEPGLALEIEYRRNIRSSRFVDTARDQWQSMELYDDARSEPWLDELSALLPDVSRGDTITVYVDEEQASVFYYNRQPIGRVADPHFTTDFLAIWLGENSNYQDERNEMINAD